MLPQIVIALHVTCPSLIGQQAGPRYSCADPPRVEFTLPINFVARQYSNGKLVILGRGKYLDPSSDDQTRFASIFDDCRSRHSRVFDALLSRLEARKTALYIYLSPHPEVPIAGMPGNDVANDKKYFFDLDAILLFPVNAPKQHPWATTRCMVLAHELEEGNSGSHAAGIDQENAIRGRPPFRTGNGTLRHGDHCDAVIPIGDSLERLHFHPSSARLANISYTS